MVSLHTLLTSALALTGTTAAASTNSTNTLNITVIGAHNNQSTLECWALTPGFAHSTQPGTEQNMLQAMGPAAGGSNVSYMVIQPRTDNGLHNAPTAQWVIFLSGLAHIALPHSPEEAYIRGGKYGAILALDTPDRSDGHLTDYPSDEETVAVEVPLAAVPGHRVLHGGGCKEEQKW
ncbi:hypothetical protein P170DRAFT_470409 [Aspergillus steynii IBT 23096]|uniref:Small secreted protein n=1 Tax=Aspergillus steynii IBT 23096 TaxID=1392250 RepID=A0A2I2GQ33_9EURO|nr:uncharacterized protein P170DRAFT_470409 [Aspergillus steynii IBT 23096]PLB54982.1 hypothetical protein P170DRAFT_470409 [Aspergillus steynii IBT 23096]